MDRPQEITEEKTLDDLMDDIARAKKPIILGAVLGAVCAALIGVFSVSQYKAEMIVGPAHPLNGAEVSSLLANDNLFALRHLVQRVGSGNDTDFLRFENIYDGPSIAAKLLEDDIVVKGVGLDRRFVFSGVLDVNGGAELAEYLHKNIKLEPVAATSLRRLSYSHPDSRFASYLLARIHDLSDHHIRSDIREDTSQRIAYLRDALDKTPNPEHRRALTTLLMEQERLRMLVSIDQPYAAKIVEPPSSRSKPSWPDYPLLFSAFILGFSFLGFVLHGLFGANIPRKNLL